MTRDTVELFGLRIHNLTMDETVARVGELIAKGGVHQHIVVNVDKVVKAARDPQIRDIVNGSDLCNVDGQPVVWASRLLGQPLKERVAGVDLMYRLIEEAGKSGHRLYFLGAKPEIVQRVVAWTQENHPDAPIAGFRNGYWKPEEEDAVVDAIAATKPDILFVAISSPKKELFLAKYKERIGAPFVMGVGGSFDVVAGLVERAPRWMQKVGLEWFYRFAQEPRRMWHRYFVEDLGGFVPLVVREGWRAVAKAAR